MKIPASKKTGAHHWIMQKITAIALIPLVIWFVLSALQIVQDPFNFMPVFFAYPLNAIMGILFITTGLYHGSLGMQVVVEDYISNKCRRNFLIILINFISIFAGVSAIVSILRLHLIG